jgi:uncharacterized protein (TIGR02466 family)
MTFVLNNKEAKSIFPTHIFKGTLNDLSLCDSIEKSVRKLHRTKNGSHVKPNSFISYDNLHESEDFKSLCELVLNEANDVLNFYQIVRDGHYISAMWANITTENHRHMLHIHPNSLLSGIIYIKTPPNCGFTTFSDPRPAARMLQPDYHQLNETNAGVFMNKPSKGDLLFWPSWLPHGVEKGDNQGTDRIVVAFNIMIRGCATLATNRMEWL